MSEVVAAELKTKYTKISLNKEDGMLSTEKPYYGYIAIEFDHLNELSPVGHFFTESQENRVLRAVKNLFGPTSEYSMEDYSILITPETEGEFEMAAKLVYEIKRIEQDFDGQMEGE